MEQMWEMVKGLAAQVVGSVFATLPGNSQKEKEDAAVQWVIDRVESVDQLLPAIGHYMDLPVVDAVERFVIDKVTREAIRLVIRQQYAVMKIEKAVSA